MNGLLVDKVLQGGGAAGYQDFGDYLEDCAHMMKQDVAMVSVKMGEAVYQRSRRGIRVTFEEKVASFGKYLILLFG